MLCFWLPAFIFPSENAPTGRRGLTACDHLQIPVASFQPFWISTKNGFFCNDSFSFSSSSYQSCPHCTFTTPYQTGFTQHLKTHNNTTTTNNTNNTTTNNNNTNTRYDLILFLTFLLKYWNVIYGLTTNHLHHLISPYL